MALSLGLFLSASLATSIPPPAQDPGPCFRVFVVETALHRHLLGLTTGRPAAYVSVFGNEALSEEGELQLDHLLLADVLDEALGEDVDPESASVAFSLMYEPPFHTSADDARGRVQDALRKVAVDVGIGTVSFSTTSSARSGGWADTFSELTVVSRASGETEPLHRGAIATVASVRTLLSRQLLSQADVYLEVRRPIREKEGYVSEVVALALDEDLAALSNAGGHVAVSLSTLVAKDGFMESMEAFQEYLGNREMTLATMSVALEEDPRADDLIGQPAPAFVLEELAGKQRKSLEELAQTKVTLLTFWGIG